MIARTLPAEFRDAEGIYFVDACRARGIVVSKDRVKLQPFGDQSRAIKVHALACFHSVQAIAGWVVVSQLLMPPALAVLVHWVSRLDGPPAGR